MNSILRYIRSKFTHEPEQHAIEQFAVFDEGNRGGFPCDIAAFDYYAGCVAIGTSSGNVTFYGYNGASWTTNVGSSSTERIKIEHIYLISTNFALVLCRGPVIIPLHMKDGVITPKDEFRFGENTKHKWNQSTHVQKLSEDAYALIFAINNTVYRIKSKTVKLEVLINNDDYEKWVPNDTELSSITTFPEKSNVIMLIFENGTVCVFNESQYVMQTTLKNFEDEAIQKLHWSSENKKNIAYGISCNNLYTKWEFTVGKDCHINGTEVNVFSQYHSGPYPCHQIKHFGVCSDVSKNKDNFLVYQGGKSSGKYDDRDLVTVVRGDAVEKFELSSEIVGIVAVDGSYEKNKKNGVILICTSCEIIGIDLDTESLSMMQPKYFLSINNSTPTTHAKSIEIEENVWNRLEAVSFYFLEKCTILSQASKSYWEAHNIRKLLTKLTINGPPIDRCFVWSFKRKHLHLGIWWSWNVSFAGNQDIFGVRWLSIQCEWCISTKERPNLLLQADPEGLRQKPAKRIGFYDPFDDDEEMCLTKVHFDPKSGFVIASNRGGFILMYELCDNARKLSNWEAIPISCNNSPPDSSKRRLLKARKSELEYKAGYQIRLKNDSALPLVFSMHSSHRVTDIAYLHKYHCLAVGSNFGVAMLDVNHGYIVYSNSFNEELREFCRMHVTIHFRRISEETSIVTQTQFQRFKSLKKSLRKTFRRKKKTPDTTLMSNSDEGTLRHHNQQITKVDDFDEEGYMERGIEVGEGLGTLTLDCYAENSKGTVSCIRTMRFPIVDDKNVDDIIAVGLQEGGVYFFAINEHDAGLRMTFKAEFVKKIGMAHKQPVINVDITNEEGYFSASTKIVIITEEQLRVYNCQPISKRESYKITALEGIKIKGGIVARILNKKNSNNFESFVVLVGNDGSLRIHSVQKTSLFETRKFIDPIDVIGLNSTCLSRDGDVAYLIKSSELQRTTVNLNFRGWSSAHKS
ncbi:Protein CBR-LGL-1 [Caenorhabditis briggsae]|uniref:Protein CBR-LGL-1 n=1 Tax=Caenorhabditis briggsae TaxID=6238 RepID=A8X5T5_CAEBR|nr:Protein CBR-LGL-1 [Caenorhabditis briggsae]CAP27996.2 Protein CBR-LGL-1 [Caenorhabditis briggsae]